MPAFTYKEAQQVSQELQAISPGCTPMIADVPQRGASKDLQFRITVWQATPGVDGTKFTLNTTQEWESLKLAMEVLYLVTARPATPASV
jgi:hypothetical protein